MTTMSNTSPASTLPVANWRTTPWAPLHPLTDRASALLSIKRFHSSSPHLLLKWVIWDNLLGRQDSLPDWGGGCDPKPQEPGIFKSREVKPYLCQLWLLAQHCSEDSFCHRSLKSSVFLNNWKLELADRCHCRTDVIWGFGVLVLVCFSRDLPRFSPRGVSKSFPVAAGR